MSVGRQEFWNRHIGVVRCLVPVSRSASHALVFGSDVYVASQMHGHHRNDRLTSYRWDRVARGATCSNATEHVLRGRSNGSHRSRILHTTDARYLVCRCRKRHLKCCAWYLPHFYKIVMGGLAGGGRSSQCALAGMEEHKTIQGRGLHIDVANCDLDNFHASDVAPKTRALARLIGDLEVRTRPFEQSP